MGVTNGNKQLALREFTAIAVLLTVTGFFGFSPQTTAFIFPEFGSEVFEIIKFYSPFLFGFATLYFVRRVIDWIFTTRWNVHEVPSISSMLLNFVIFFIPSYFIIYLFLSGGDIMSSPLFPPLDKQVIEQGIVAISENTISFIFLATIFPLGAGVGNMLKKPIEILPKFRDYWLRFDPPNFNRFIYGQPAIIFTVLLHAGAYAYQVTSTGNWFVSMTIVYVLFTFMFWLMQSFGYGACVGFHLAWNLALISIRGSVI